MITLNDYLYSGDTVFRILQKYSDDLRMEAKKTGNEVDMIHCNFLLQIMSLLEHNDFLTVQSQKIKEFYKYMTEQYPYLAFTFKGRIKSLIRAEEKFNGYVVEYIHDFYMKYGRYPDMAEFRDKLSVFRDLIAYRIVISVPKCHMEEGMDQTSIETKYLYEIANILPGFLEERGFTVERAGLDGAVQKYSDRMNESVRPYYRDYITNPRPLGYQALHVTLYDNSARCHVEVQLRTKEMDDYAEIGPANHLGYEQRQVVERSRRDDIPKGECVYFDDAYERGIMLQKLELSKLSVNMFAAVNNSLINDGCGLYRGRQILPYEHLSRFQNDYIGN